uniref:Uncharacterized protein n=1 Tax=Cuerna arida TaxID=1464854 RepID=A0A1B6EHZ9_9HEMI
MAITLIWFKSCLIFLIVTICFGDLFDTVVESDKEAIKIFNEPRGSKDTDMYKAIKTVGDAYELLTKHLRIRNSSVVDVSKRLCERGTPALLTEVFSTDNLRVVFGWVDSDLRYFNYVYNDVHNKWNSFEREFKNASLYM